MNSNDVAYLGFLFGFGFTVGSGLIICIGLGITALHKLVTGKFRSRDGNA